MRSLLVTVGSLLVLVTLSVSGASRGSDRSGVTSTSEGVIGRGAADMTKNAHVRYDWRGPGVVDVQLLSAAGDVLLSGHAESGRVEIDGLRFQLEGSTLYVSDGPAYVGTFDLARQSEIVSGASGQELMSYLRTTRASKAVLFQTFADKLLPPSEASGNTISVKVWCDFGAGCACNQSTLLTFGAVLSTAGAALSGNWLGYAGGLIATGVAYNNELTQCSGWN